MPTDTLFVLVLILALGCVAAWVLAGWFFRAEDLSRFDGLTEGPGWRRFGLGAPSSPELGRVEAGLAELGRSLQGVHGRQRIQRLRVHLDQAFAGREQVATFTPVDCDGIPGEWVLAPGADPARHTLYLHGGGFVIGSVRSHRTLTSAFSRLTGGAVLAIDYRLMPEHPRRAGIEDSRRAWGWMLAQGPNSGSTVSDDSPARQAFVAGDSAGGNLTLALIGWLRDGGGRQADAAVALSPLTDSCLASPSLWRLRERDVMLGPMLGQLMRLSPRLLVGLTWVFARIDPRGPTLSPLRGDLAGLPPTLLLASEAEMLLDDARRYTARARAAGSPVRLATWAHPVHAWPIFQPELPEAREALAEVGRFFDELGQVGAG
jgi:acetyl esterase/lipase